LFARAREPACPLVGIGGDVDREGIEEKFTTYREN